MPAARLRNALARALWQAGCWLQLAARRLEVAGPATATLEPAVADEWELSVPELARPGGPPPHWQRLLDGRDPRQLHAAPRPAAAPAERRLPEPNSEHMVGQETILHTDLSRHFMQHGRPTANQVEGGEVEGPPPHWQRLLDGRDPRQLHAAPRPAAAPAERRLPEPHSEHMVGQETILHTDLSRHFMQHGRPTANQVEGGEVEGPPPHWPSLPDDTPLWTPEWPDPVRERVARLDEEQRGTPWSG